jgi:hypothetical protein
MVTARRWSRAMGTRSPTKVSAITRPLTDRHRPLRAALMGVSPDYRDASMGRTLIFRNDT